jgi:hypothetical protein
MFLLVTLLNFETLGQFIPDRTLFTSTGQCIQQPRENSVFPEEHSKILNKE